MSSNAKTSQRPTSRRESHAGPTKGSATRVVSFQTKIAKQGNSLGVRIPKEMIDGLGFKQGDPVQLRQSEDRIEIIRADDTYTRAMEIGRAFSLRYRRALAKLSR